MKNLKLSLLVVEETRLTMIDETGEASIRKTESATSQSQADKMKDKILMKLAIMEQMVEEGELIFAGNSIDAPAESYSSTSFDTNFTKPAGPVFTKSSDIKAVSYSKNEFHVAELDKEE